MITFTVNGGEKHIIIIAFLWSHLWNCITELFSSVTGNFSEKSQLNINQFSWWQLTFHTHPHRESCVHMYVVKYTNKQHQVITIKIHELIVHYNATVLIVCWAYVNCFSSFSWNTNYLHIRHKWIVDSYVMVCKIIHLNEGSKCSHPRKCVSFVPIEIISTWKWISPLLLLLLLLLQHDRSKKHKRISIILK